MMRAAFVVAPAAIAAMCFACGPEGTATDPDTGSTVDTNGGTPVFTPSTIGNGYTLRPEWTGPCAETDGVIDVNLGNSPESFVTAAYCQISGTMPPLATVNTWVNQLLTVSYVRRVDVVRTLCQQANKTCGLFYSNPWSTEELPTDTCARKTTRDVGAVMMFFFDCPGGTNCGMDWANTHAWGMPQPDPTYASGPDAMGLYTPSNEGFWLRELLDARHAGLQFVAPNVYGFDIQPSTGELANLESALDAIDAMGGGMQVALFNDTWAWGNPAGGTLQNPAPSLSDTEDAAQRIYAVQWKPFYQGISKPHWYTVDGAPLIYFYNAGTLVPTSGASAVIARLKQLFMTDFGVVPFVNVDRGYGAVSSADAQFVWDTIDGSPATYLGSESTVTGGLTFDNAMVKWDSLGRDSPGAIATSSTRILKGPDILDSVLSASTGANLLLLETWNDLGEGTGITRNYDYYYQGAWLTPDAFMSAIRASQCSN
jgi:Domain of unknown function (DUF5010)